MVADCKYRSLMADAPLLLYVPLFQNYSASTTILVHTASSPLAALEPVRQEVAAVDRDLPVFGARTMQMQVATSLWQPRMGTGLIAVFGILALFLSSLGIYGAMAHAVAQRTREIGIRMALGAEPSDVLRSVARRSVRLLARGLAIGAAGEFFCRRFLSAAVVGVQIAEPITWMAAGSVLIAAALLASYLPAHRAMRIDRAVALRSE